MEALVEHLNFVCHMEGMVQRAGAVVEFYSLPHITTCLLSAKRLGSKKTVAFLCNWIEVKHNLTSSTFLVVHMAKKCVRLSRTSFSIMFLALKHFKSDMMDLELLFFFLLLC